MSNLTTNGTYDLRKRKGSTASTISSISSASKLSRQYSTTLKQVESPDQPIHCAQDSLFSSSSGWTNYSGFFNLAILLLVVSNGRVALENLIKYGILISPISWIDAVSTDIANAANIFLLVGSNITILLCFITEKIAARGYINDKFVSVIYTLTIFTNLTLPPYIIIHFQPNPLFSVATLMIIVIETLKLISYGQVNYWCRSSNEYVIYTDRVNYPHNLTLRNLYFFMFAPTLCYELNYPRTPRLRKSFIAKRISELIVFVFVIIALCQQWVMPLVKNSLGPFSEMDVSRCVERILKLAIPNHVIWLMIFYTMFHSFMNLLAELTRFADREFYRDFWNSETISYFWRSWNIPVHRWAVRHVYKPMIANGYSKIKASGAVFLISAFFHEYLVSVPLSMFRLWAFYGMLAQLPLSYITDKIIGGGRAGNIIVWLSLILGQPMAILMYVHDWYLINYPAHVNATA